MFLGGYVVLGGKECFQSWALKAAVHQSHLCVVYDKLFRETLPGIELSWQIVSCDSVSGIDLILDSEFMAIDHSLLQLIKSKSLAFGPA